MTAATVLFVDDEAGVLRAIKRSMRGESFRVVTASSGPEGLDVLARQPIQAVFSDQRMADMPGTEFLKRVRYQYPDTVRCILSGYAEMEAVVSAINDGNVYRFLAKPWDDAELIAAVYEALERAGSLETRRRAEEDLQQQSAKYADLIKLQESLLRSSRELLENLPIAVAAVDSSGRMMYVNREFASAFGHLPGTLIGQAAGDPWRTAAEQTEAEITLAVDGAPHLARVARVAIGGQPHALIAMPGITTSDSGA